jgi:TonB-linked SusC/RagA family outer membrane protein
MKKNEMMHSHFMRGVLKWCIMIKLLWIMIAASVLQVSAGTSPTYSQAAKVSLKLTKVDLEKVIWSIKNQTEFNFFYSSEEVRKVKDLDVNMENVTAQDVLDKCLQGTNLTYEIVHKAVIIKSLPISVTNEISKPVGQLNKKELKGKIVDSKGNAIPGITVLVKGTTIGTITNVDGYFSIQVPLEAKFLVCSFVGMKTQEIQIGSSMNYNIVMEEESVGLDEVVAIGYGAQKKVSITSAISTVGSEDLVKAPVGNVGTAMVGRLTGLTAIQRSGQPGADFPSISIRGSSDPLVIVDGVERASGHLITQGDGTSGAVSGWEAINPNDIESISILKDASATAVYGVRGANGVIIITTKKGFSGETTIDYSGNFSMSTPVRPRHNLGSYEYGLYANEGYYNDGRGAFMTYDDMNKYRYNYSDVLYPSIDYSEYMLKKFSTKHSHNISVRGGTENTKCFVSVGYYDEDGLIKNREGYGFDPNLHYNRLNLRSNLDFQFTKRFSGSINIDARIEKRQGANAPFDNQFFWKMYQAHPWISPGFDKEGRYIETNIEKDVLPVFTYVINGGFYHRNQITANSVFSLKYDLDFIAKGLSTQAKYSFDSYVDTWYTRSRSYATYQPIEANGTIYYRRTGDDGELNYSPQTPDKRKKIYFDASLDYSRLFGNHALSALALYNMEKSYYFETSFADIPHAYLGFVGRVTYNYKKRYFGEFNIGINGSENFPKGKRFGVFPAYSVGWLMSDEKFMQSIKFLSYLKLRGSYGQVGNDLGTKRFLYLQTTYSNYPSAYVQWYGEPTTSSGSIQAIQEGVSSNNNVTWETTTKYNIGVDAKLFNERMNFTFDYFNEDRDNILTIMQTIPSFQFPQVSSNSGFPTSNYLTDENYGKTSTHGLEIELGWNGKIGKDFRYNLRGTYAYAIKKATRLSEIPKNYPWLYSQGYISGEVRGLICEGYWNSYEEINNPNNPYNIYSPHPIPGDLKYKDINGDMKINENDMVPLGNSNKPRSTFTGSIGLSWKNWDVTALFQGATDVVYQPSAENQIMMNEGQGGFTWISDRWTPQTRTGSYPVLHSTNQSTSSNFIPSSFWTYDATYIRLKNLEIGYNIHSPLFERLKIDKVKIYLTGQNLWTYTPIEEMKKYDPEMVQGRLVYYPIMQVYNFGVSVTF